MSRYYLDIVHDGGCIHDNEGVELPSADALRTAVARAILDMARDEIDEEDFAQLQVRVRDDSDYVLFIGTLQYSVAWS